MGRILIVDDDHAILALLRLILSQEGHDILWAHEAREAINLLRLHQVDLLLIDVVMPELSGFQLAQMIKINSHLQDTPLAFVTARNKQSDVLKAADIGASFYITKPIIREDLIAKVNSCFKERSPKSGVRYCFEQPAVVKARIHQSAHIIAISDMGVELHSSVDYPADQIIDLEASFLKEVPIKNLLLKVMSSRPEYDGFYRVNLVFVDLSLEFAQRIQNWIAHRGLRR